jgi:membrane protease YdiL (CAAX protease family)
VNGRTGRIVTLSQWTCLLLGLIVVFALFHSSALALSSDRGQAGLVVAALAVAATLAVERVCFGLPLPAATRSVGLGRPNRIGMTASIGVSVLLLASVPLFARATGSSVTFLPDAIGLLPGLFAQAGIAEEVLFRGYLFGHLRRGRTFWRAAVLSTVPFVGVHLLLFATMPWPVALAALMLSVATSFPLARLFELGGFTIWAPAILHFVIQATVKVLAVGGSDAAGLFPFVWMAASAAVPLLAFAVPAGKPLAGQARVD